MAVTDPPPWATWGWSDALGFVRWPGFAETWFGGEYPAGRGTAPAERGWQCPECLRVHAPSVLSCRFHGPDAQQEAKPAGPAVPVMGEWTEET